MKRRSLMLVLAAAAACASNSGTIGLPPSANSAPAECDDPYIEVVNRTGKPLDIYGMVGSSGLFLGQVASTDNRLSLIGTPLERQYGSIYAMADGRRLGLNSTGSVQLTRKCGTKKK